MNVLSLFDGISCGRVALERAGCKVRSYYASEIDKHAIKVAKDTVLTTLEPGRHPDAFKKNLPYRNYTKTERCRLMNLPDNYCDSISYNQAVKATGNGWEVGMVAHIFSHIN